MKTGQDKKFARNYSVKRINNFTSPPEQRSNKISFAFSAPLLEQIKDLLSSQ